MSSLISADRWPVFERYELVRGSETSESVAPAQGAHVRTWANLMDPAARRDALESLTRLVKYPDRQPSLKRMAQYMGLGEIDRRGLIEYAERYGLLGIGPSYIVRVVQHLPRRRYPHRLTVRVAGELRQQPSTEAWYGDPAVTLLRPWELSQWTWHYTRQREKRDVFGLDIGSAEWWSTYAEPVNEIVQAIGSLQADPVTIEPLLSDTFIRLPIALSTRIDTAYIVERSVSALGALALDVMHGGLEGVRICEYELCRRRFKPRRRDQVFCSVSCRTSHHDRQKRLGEG